MTGEQNLKTEISEMGIEKGKTGRKTRKKRKMFKQLFNELLADEIAPQLAQALKEKNNSLGIDTTGFTVAEYIGLAQMAKAVGGDTKSFEVIRDTVGEKPADKKEINLKEIPKINVVRKNG